MNGEEKKQMSVVNKIINIFASPREALESINEKPTWLVPYVIIVIFFLFMMYMTLDVQMNDQMAALEARDMTEQQMEAAKSQMQGPARYAGFVVGPIFMLGVNALFAACVLLAANLMIGGQEIGFKKIFSMLMWTGLVGIIGLLITTFLAVQKGTMAGVSMDLSILLPVVPAGESKSFMHHLLARFDLFVIWQLILWIIGLSVMYKTTVQKAVAPVLTLWIIWIVVAVGFSMLASKFIPGM
jgi:hypothetical protein